MVTPTRPLATINLTLEADKKVDSLDVFLDPILKRPNDIQEWQDLIRCSKKVLQQISKQNDPIGKDLKAKLRTVLFGNLSADVTIIKAQSCFTQLVCKILSPKKEFQKVKLLFAKYEAGMGNNDLALNLLEDPLTHSQFILKMRVLHQDGKYQRVCDYIVENDVFIPLALVSIFADSVFKTSAPIDVRKILESRLAKGPKEIAYKFFIQLALYYALNGRIREALIETQNAYQYAGKYHNWRVLCFERMLMEFNPRVSDEDRTRVRNALRAEYKDMTELNQKRLLLISWFSVEIVNDDFSYVSNFINIEECVKDFASEKNSKITRLMTFFLIPIYNAIQQGKMGEALKFIKTLMSVFPKIPIVLRLHNIIHKSLANDRASYDEISSVLAAEPKTGPFWTAKAQHLLNPLSEYFNLEEAEACLEKAMNYTPQHFDTIIEQIRLKKIQDALYEKGLIPKPVISGQALMANFLRIRYDDMFEYSDSILWTACQFECGGDINNPQVILDTAISKVSKRVDTFIDLYEKAFKKKITCKDEKLYLELSSALGSNIDLFQGVLKPRRAMTFAQRLCLLKHITLTNPWEV